MSSCAMVIPAYLQSDWITAMSIGCYLKNKMIASL